MVSTFRYRSFKKINLRQRWTYRIVLPVAAVLMAMGVLLSISRFGLAPARADGDETKPRRIRKRGRSP